jgi:hypothetical protein
MYIYIYIYIIYYVLYFFIIGDSEYAFLVNSEDQRRDRVYIDAADEQKSNLMRYSLHFFVYKS